MDPLVRESSYLPRYLVIGAISFLIDSSVFTLVFNIVGPEKTRIASLAGGAAAFLFNFWGHRNVTFQNEDKARWWLEFLPHLGLKIVNESIRAEIMQHFVGVLGYNVFITYLAASVWVSVTNFVISRWIFARQSPRHLWKMLKEFSALKREQKKELFITVVVTQWEAIKVRLRK